MTSVGFRALLVLAICTIAEPAWAATKAIGRIESDSFRVLVVESDTGVSLAVSSSTMLKATDASVSYTEDPARVIIDIPLIKKSQNTDKLDLQHALLKGVRIGAHPEKTRIVIDLRRPTALRHSVSRVESLGALLIHLHSGAEKREMEVAKVPEVVAEPKEEKRITTEDPARTAELQKAAREREALRAARSKLARAGAVITADGVIVHKGKNDGRSELAVSEPSLRGISFVEDAESGLDALALDITESKGYSLRTLGSGEYEVRLRSARVHAALPSSTGLGFEQLALGQEGADALLRIRVKRGLALGASQSDRGLELRLSRE